MGNDLAKPKTTGYEWTDYEDYEQSDPGRTRRFPQHTNPHKYETNEYGGLWNDDHTDPHEGQAKGKQQESDELGLVQTLRNKPQWSIRTEAKAMSTKTAEQMFTPPKGIRVGPGGVAKIQGISVAVKDDGSKTLYVPKGISQAGKEAIRAWMGQLPGWGVTMVDDSKFQGLARSRGRMQDGDSSEMFTQEAPTPEPTPMFASAAKRLEVTMAAKAKTKGLTGVDKKDMKIISELLDREDARPTGQAVKMKPGTTVNRMSFTRYQIPTDRGVKDIEIWGDEIHVRSHGVYGIPKKAEFPTDLGEDDAVSIAPDEGMPADVGDAGVGDEMDGMEEEVKEKVVPDTSVHVRLILDRPDEMEDEETLSILDEVMQDEGVLNAFRDALDGTGISVSALEMADDDMDDMDDMDDDMDMDDMDEGDMDMGMDEGGIDNEMDTGEGEANYGMMMGTAAKKKKTQKPRSATARRRCSTIRTRR